MGDIPSWAVPLVTNVGVALTMLGVLSSQLGAIKRELRELTKEFSATRADIAKLQNASGYQEARIEKLEERINKLADYWQRRHEPKP